MRADRNIVELSGRLVRDVRLGETRDGKTYGAISMVIRGFSDKPEFYDVFIWKDRLIESYGKYLRSGKRVVIRGHLSRRDRGMYINVTEDYGVMVCVDVRDLKKEIGSKEWAEELEEENEAYEKRLRELEGKEEIASETEIKQPIINKE